MGLLQGKTAVVTGGAQGIGLSIAKRFQDEGANVVICDIAEDRLSELLSQMSLQDQVLTVKADVTLLSASDQSAYITGVLLNVDDGRHMAMNRT